MSKQVEIKETESRPLGLFEQIERAVVEPGKDPKESDTKETTTVIKDGEVISREVKRS